MTEKNIHAVALGRMGGLAREKNLSKEQKTAISLKANAKRWEGHIKKTKKTADTV